MGQLRLVLKAIRGPEAAASATEIFAAGVVGRSHSSLSAPNSRRSPWMPEAVPYVVATVTVDTVNSVDTLTNR
jgi:hypothetical protein